MTRKRRAEIVQLIVTAIRLGAPWLRAGHTICRCGGSATWCISSRVVSEWLTDCRDAVSLAVRQELEALAQQRTKEDDAARVIQPDGRLYVDNSILATEAVCQTRRACDTGWMRRPGVRVKMNVRTAVHAGWMFFAGGGAWRPWLAAFEAAYTAMGIGQMIAAMDEKQQKSYQAYTLENLRVIMGSNCVRNAHLPFGWTWRRS